MPCLRSAWMAGVADMSQELTQPGALARRLLLAGGHDMRHGVFAFALAWSMATSVTDQSPTKPDFSGTWRLDPAASVLTPPPGVSGDATAFSVSPTLLKPIVIAQNARTLALTQTPGDEAFTFTYQLDGSPSKLAWPSG